MGRDLLFDTPRLVRHHRDLFRFHNDRRLVAALPTDLARLVQSGHDPHPDQTQKSLVGQHAVHNRRARAHAGHVLAVHDRDRHREPNPTDKPAHRKKQPETVVHYVLHPDLTLAVDPSAPDAPVGPWRRARPRERQGEHVAEIESRADLALVVGA